MKPETSPVDSSITYVDDILVMHHDAMTPLQQINFFFNMKTESLDDPDNQENTAYSGRKWPRRDATPFMKYYLPELYISEELFPEEAN